MATGPEHYAEAERLLAEAAREPYGSNKEGYVLRAAQVHATLALAAATVATRAVGPQEGWGGHSICASDEWRVLTE